MGDDLEVGRLVARARAGDRQAFGELYDRYAERVFRFALARLPEPADAEDLVQRVFLKAIEALPRYEERGLPFGAWLFRIARNALIDRDRVRRPTLPLDDAAQAHAAEHEQPARAVELSAEQERVRAALAALTAEQRDVLVYRYFAGLTPSEIAALMGKREGSVRSLQFRALAAMKRRLEPESPAAGRLAEDVR